MALETSSKLVARLSFGYIENLVGGQSGKFSSVDFLVLAKPRAEQLLCAS